MIFNLYPVTFVSNIFLRFHFWKSAKISLQNFSAWRKLFPQCAMHHLLDQRFPLKTDVIFDIAYMYLNIHWCTYLLTVPSKQMAYKVFTAAQRRNINKNGFLNKCLVLALVPGLANVSMQIIIYVQYTNILFISHPLISLDLSMKMIN